MFPGVNEISWKANVANINRAGGSGVTWSLSAGVLGSKEHLDLLKIDMNVTEIITGQDYKHEKLMWMEVHISVFFIWCVWLHAHTPGHVPLVQCVYKIARTT